MDKIEVLSPLSIVQDAEAGKRARVRLPNGSEVTVVSRLEDGRLAHTVGQFLRVASAAKPLTKERFSRYEYTNKSDGHKFTKWNLRGCQFKVILEPLSDKYALLAEEPKIADFVDTTTAEDTALLDSIAVSPAKAPAAKPAATVDASLLD